MPYRYQGLACCRIAAVGMVLLIPAAVRADAWPAAVEAALVEAKANRAELENVLRHYQSAGDSQKFEAACFLIANMPGHAYVSTALFDAKKNVISFDVLRYPGFGEAQRALSELEKQHGPLTFARQKVIRDLETLTAAYLIEDMDCAFRAWREKPWARPLSFPAFCEYILPYRANREPVERWRAACEIPTATIVAEMKDPGDPREAAALVMKHTKHRLGFSDLYYLHPTDQGFAEMCRKPVGRCGDMSNLQVYVYRANGIAVAGDYTPFWANRDNNHGWEVLLDKDGRGHAGLFNKAAKVYRKTFAHHRDNLFFQADKGAALPPWLALRSYRDVTDQYMATTHVTLALDPPSRPTRFAYLCVFNGGKWQPIHWGRVQDGQATFTKMGRGIVYLAGYYLDGKVVPAAPPFLLDDKSQQTKLAADARQMGQVRLTDLRPAIKDDDLKKELPGKGVEKGKAYELFVWERGWKSLGKTAAGPTDPAVLGRLPVGGLYWLVTADNRETARIFTIEGGKQRFW